jgi:biopolymer transport protein ExbB/TolQ
MPWTTAFRMVGQTLLPAPVGWPIILVTWAIAGLAITHLVKQWRATRTEERLLDSLLTVVDAPGGDGETQGRTQGGARAFGETNVAKELAKAPKSSVIRRYTGILLMQRDMPRPDMAAILETAAQPYVARLDFPRITPNLTMLIGLVGTIVGLATVVRSLGPDVLQAANSLTPQEMARALSPQIQNLGTAFVCTLHGLLAAILIALLHNRAEHQQNRLLTRVEAFGLNSLVPRIFPASLESQLEQISAVLNDSRDFVQTVAESMNVATDNMKRQVETFDKTTQEASNALKLFLLHAQTAADKLNSSIEAMQNLQIKVHEVYTSLMQRHDRAEESFKGRVEEIVGAVRGLQTGFNTNAQAIIAQLQEAAKNYETSTSDFRMASFNFRNMSKEIGADAYQAIAGTADQFQNALRAHQKAIDLVEASLRELMSRLDPRLLPSESWDGVLSALDRVVEAENRVIAHLTALSGTNDKPARGTATTSQDGPRER